jgi:hypothetical protein
MVALLFIYVQPKKQNSMASTSEKGHATNVANLETMIAIVTEDGSKYNPARPELKISSLKISLSNGQAALQKLKDEKADYDLAIIARDTIFDPLKKFATKVMAAVKACDVSKSVYENLKAVNDKIQGKSTTATKASTTTASNGETAAKKKNSTSRQSHKSVIDHFELLVSILAKEPKYTPNEPEMSVAGIKALIVEMRAKNEAATTAETKLQNARDNRDAAIYTSGTGVVPLAAGIKSYTKSVYGSTSPQFIRLNKLQFTNKPR